MKADRRAQRQEDLFFKLLDYIDLNDPDNSPKFSRAVFQIPYIFNDKEKIRQAQKQFLLSAQSASGDREAFSQAAIELLLTIARESKYKDIEESNIRLRYQFKAEKLED